jgi:hypothetical protein
MVRIHRGMPLRPLPMQAPVAQVAQPANDGWVVGPGGVWVQPQPQPQGQPTQSAPQDPLGNMVDQLLRDVIGTLGGQW